MAVLCTTLLAGSARAAFITNVTIDGTNSEWAGAFNFRDRNETTAPAGGGTDIPDNYDVDTVRFANNATYLYWSASTYGNISGQLTWRIYIDVANNTAQGGAYGNDDRYVEFTTNNGNCVDVTVFRASNDNEVSNPGCGSGANRNLALTSTSKFIEGRIQLSWLYTNGNGSVPTNGNVNYGLLLTVTPTGGGTGELAPGQPLPSFMDYDNRGTVVPTFVRVRGLTAEAGQGGVVVRWRTSAEYFSAGTWVVRASGDEWVPVSPQPSATQNLATGDSYTVVDPNGGPDDVYALVEVDSRTMVRVFGPVTAVKSAVTVPSANVRLHGETASNLMRRAVAFDAHLRNRYALLRSLRDLPLQERLTDLDVDVTREGLFVVCDADTMQYGGVPASVTLRGETVRAFAVSTPCAGMGFYAAAPSSPYAPFDVYRVQLATLRNLSTIAAPPTETYDGPLAPATLSALITPRRYLDMRDGTPNRFFWSYAATSPTAPIPVPAIAGSADLTVDVHPLSGGATHTLVVASDHELGRYTVGEGWSRVSLPALDVANAPAITFVVDADPGVIETVLLADATLRYSGTPTQSENGVHFSVGGDAWVGVQSGHGFAFDVTQPTSPGLLATAPMSSSLGVHTQIATREVFVAETFSRLEPVPKVVEPLIDDAGAAVDYLVLTPTPLAGTARDLALLREEEGLRTAVITYEALYDRFSGGNPDPSTVAKLLDWVAVRWGTAPRYLVLVGSTSADPYGYTGALRTADAPIFEGLDTTFTYRRYSDRDLSGSHAIAVGRIPTSDVAELSLYIDKLRAHRDTAPIGQWAMMNGASGPTDPHFAGLVGNIAAQIAESVAVQRFDMPTTDDLVNAWGNVDVIAYAGHGDSESWADDVLYRELVPNLTTERAPVTLSVACMDGMSTSASGGLAWSLVSAESGRGSIAAIAPSSIVEPIAASAFLGRVAAAIAHGEAARWGDAWLLAQESEQSIAARSMVFVGDPALTP